MISTNMIDFYEIQDPHLFELFAMSYLQLKGYTIERRPAVGADGGKDMIVSQPVAFGGAFRWLVSCKHRISGLSSIGSNDDGIDITKVMENLCQGILFVYSRPISESLLRHFETVARQYNLTYGVFTNYEIQQDLVSDPRYYSLISQCFPQSYSRLIGHVQEGSCACTYEMGGIFLIPYFDHTVGVVKHEKVCGYCYSGVQDGLEAGGFKYGEGVCIVRDPND
ncbi:restriction endonuclease [Pseudomonas hunanensis]|uniref:restriction endonuclease n=1 Tax=Pseudomonas hunanensis TaxID=1247546 RepID=UPI0030D856F5